MSSALLHSEDLLRPDVWYILAYFFLLFVVPLGFVTLFFDAPFGKFSWHESSLNVNANAGWFAMEIVSPLMFLYGLCTAASAHSGASVTSGLHLTSHAYNLCSSLAALPITSKVLSACYLIHYLNRSVVFVITHPEKRSPMHLLTLAAGVCFNLANGYLMGSWFGGRTVPKSATTLFAKASSGSFIFPCDSASSKVLFFVGLALWTAGFALNIVHDQILLNLRRKPAQTQKANGAASSKRTTKKQPAKSQSSQAGSYSIPFGLGFDYPCGGCSSPSYVAEWIEWTGFALASYVAFRTTPSALPPITSFGSSTFPSLSFWALGKATTASRFLITLTWLSSKLHRAPIPPLLMLVAEVATMTPRALRVHEWYLSTFKASYPSERAAIIPGLL